MGRSQGGVRGVLGKMKQLKKAELHFCQAYHRDQASLCQSCVKVRKG